MYQGPSVSAQEEVKEAIAKQEIPKLTKEEFAEFRANIEANEANKELTEEEIKAIESAWNAKHPQLSDDLKKAPRDAKELDPKLLEDFAKMGLKSKPLVQPAIWNLWSKKPKFANELEPMLADKQKKAAADLNRFTNVVIASPSQEQIAKDCLLDPSKNRAMVIQQQLQRNHRTKFAPLYSTPSTDQITADCGTTVSQLKEATEGLDTVIEDKRKHVIRGTYK